MHDGSGSAQGIAARVGEHGGGMSLSLAGALTGAREGLAPHDLRGRSLGVDGRTQRTVPNVFDRGSFHASVGGCV